MNRLGRMPPKYKKVDFLWVDVYFPYRRRDQMGILQVKVYPAQVLRERAQEVKNIDEDTKSLIENMAQTMYAYKGIGLAAPQVGVSERVITFDIGEGLISLINPFILEEEGEEAFEEGCLSLPGIRTDVKRARKILVRGMDVDGKERELEVGGLLARIILHEVDHLNGLLIVDRVSALRRRLLEGKIRKLRKEGSWGE